MLNPFENEIFVKENFGSANLNDERLTKRLQLIAGRMANRPETSIPTQMENWNDTKACYDFFKNPKVTHKRIQLAHRERIKQLAKDVNENNRTTLFIQDLSELDYTTHQATKDLGQVGNQYGRGIQMHSCLAIKPGSHNLTVLGLAHQIVWERKEEKDRGKHKIGEQFRGNKESITWSQTLRAIGRPPENCRWISISDRGSDCDELFYEAKRLKWDLVVRALHNRYIEVNGETRRLKEFSESLKSQGQHSIFIRLKGETKEKQISLDVAWERDVIITPSGGNGKKIEVSIIKCWNKEEEIEWILYSTIKVSNVEEAIEKIKWYCSRWTIEEYHKCIKTGCGIESSQLEAAKRLESLIGIMGIIAILMLQLRSLARESGDELANECVPKIPLKIICNRFKLNSNTLSIYEFWRAVARMGGFLNRKSDGEPGWQTLWLGWLRLLDMMAAIDSFEYS